MEQGAYPHTSHLWEDDVLLDTIMQMKHLFSTFNDGTKASDLHYDFQWWDKALLRFFVVIGTNLYLTLS